LKKRRAGENEDFGVLAWRGSGMPSEALAKAGMPSEALAKAGMPSEALAKAGMPSEALAKAGGKVVTFVEDSATQPERQKTICSACPVFQRAANHREPLEQAGKD